MEPTVYKTLTLDELNNRTTRELTPEVQIETQTITQNFINYFKAAHS